MSQESKHSLFALLIGIDCYLPNSVSGSPNPMNLGGCVRDINRVREYLLNEVGLPQDHLLELTASNTGEAMPSEPAHKWPTRRNIIESFERLGEMAPPGAHVYIHYSGHGGRVKTPPRFLREKRGDGFDEALVPCDFSYEQDNFLRDFELAHILKTYVERHLLVTVVLDSCHSGGATRGDQSSRVRSIGTVRQGFPEPRIPVATDDQLADVARSLSQLAKRNVAAQTDWRLEVKGYVLIAACRPSEFAYEHPFDRSELSGALTYSLIDSLRQMGPGTPIKTIYNRTLAMVQQHIRNQTPQLQGETDRVFFSSQRVKSPDTVTVLQAPDAEDQLELNMGQAQGITVGARFEIFGARDLSLSHRLALVRVNSLGATSSRAVIIEKFDTNPIQQGDQAVLVETNLPQAGRTVRLLAPKSDSIEVEGAMNALRRALDRRPTSVVRLAEKGTTADFSISINESAEYEIRDSAGAIIPNLQSGPRIDVANAPDRLIERLFHLARYFAVRDLKPRDPFSPLWNRLSAELQGWQPEYVMGDAPVPQCFASPSGIPEIKTGEWAFLKIRNASNQDLNVTVLNLRPDWSIRQIYPAGAAAFEPMDPGAELTLPLLGDLPLGLNDGMDVIKVFATSGPSNFRCLELPKLDCSENPARWRGGHNDLDEFIRTNTQADSSTRDLTTGDLTSHHWTAAQIEIIIRRNTP